MAEGRDLPLLRWAEDLRRARLKRDGFRRRAAIAAGGIACVLATIGAPPAPRLLWNASPSAPMGLYRVEPGSTPSVGDMVAAWAPHPARTLAADRGYLPEGVPLVKRVAAALGATVCADSSSVIVGGRLRVVRRHQDALGRPLPSWRGCRTLRGGELFLLMAEVPDSFDGRYFGVTASTEVIGKAVLLWRH